MNLKKTLTAFACVASLGFVACSSDSSSGSDPAENSSSSAAAVELPETSGDSLVKFQAMAASPSGATSIIFTGVISTAIEIDTAAFIDSIQFQLANSEDIQISSSFSFSQLTAPVQQISLNSLKPALDLTSFSDCGSLFAYVIAYGHNDSKNFVAIDTIPFSKQCVVEESSSSAAEISDPELSVWEITLSTSATIHNAVDLDSKTLIFQQQRDENAASLDLYLGKSGSDPVLYTNGNLINAGYSQIVPETKSGADYVDYPKKMSDFGYKGTPGVVADDFELTSSYIVLTPEYDETTGKGFYVILPHSPKNAGSSITMDITVLGVW